MHRNAAAALAALAACSSSPGEPELRFVAVTFNTGTTAGLSHGTGADDGYGDEQAAISDQWYGDGMAWAAVVDDARAWFAALQPDVVAFQEIFYTGDCAGIPEGPERAGFVCETWTEGDPTVAQVAVGAGYQVACNPGKPDKCIAVRRAFGTIHGCAGELCLDGLDGTEIEGCGGGSRLGRATVELTAGGAITVVGVHGSSGLTTADQACREQQFDAAFALADGAANVVLGDLNTDPGRFLRDDTSAARFAELVASRGFAFVSEVGDDAPRSYGDAVDIDHVVSDAYTGSCWIAGLTDGHPAVTDMVYFDHKPIVCTLEGDLP